MTHGNGGRVERVEAFVAAWNRADRDAVLGAFAEDAVYHNVPMAPFVGKAAIDVAITALLRDMRGIDWRIAHIAETRAGAVLTERLDLFTLRDRAISMPVMGIFEFRGNLILRWSDYFDLASYRAQLAGVADIR